MSAKKVLAGVILLAAVAGGVYYFLKNRDKNNATQPLETDETDKDLPAPATKSLEDETFEEMDATLRADPVWNNSVFPGDFMEAVAADYQNVKAGNPRHDNYKWGKPGAFMSVVDAWKDDMGISSETHSNLWTLYSNYRSEVAKSQL